jgi:hypothetical protein
MDAARSGYLVRWGTLTLGSLRLLCRLAQTVEAFVGDHPITRPVDAAKLVRRPRALKAATGPVTVPNGTEGPTLCGSRPTSPGAHCGHGAAVESAQAWQRNRLGRVGGLQRLQPGPGMGTASPTYPDSGQISWPPGSLVPSGHGEGRAAGGVAGGPGRTTGPPAQSLASSEQMRGSSGWALPGSPGCPRHRAGGCRSRRSWPARNPRCVPGARGRTRGR